MPVTWWGTSHQMTTRKDPAPMIHLFALAAIALGLSFIDGADQDALICASILVPLFIGVAILA